MQDQYFFWEGKFKKKTIHDFEVNEDFKICK